MEARQKWERRLVYPRRWLAAGLNLVLPSICVLCQAQAGDTPVCPGCTEKARAQSPERCPQCANPLPSPMPQPSHSPMHPPRRTPCGACLSRRPAFDATIAALDYAAPADGLILQLKFAARLILAPWFAEQLRLTVAAQRHLILPNVLCPIPLGRQRLRERGYNQALEIARPLGKALNLAVWPELLVRSRETPAQSSLPPNARRANIRNAFTLNPAKMPHLAGQHIGLVDDVMSSGHTLNEAAALLKRHGAARVTNLVAARTPPH